MSEAGDTGGTGFFSGTGTGLGGGAALRGAAATGAAFGTGFFAPGAAFFGAAVATTGGLGLAAGFFTLAVLGADFFAAILQAPVTIPRKGLGQKGPGLYRPRGGCTAWITALCSWQPHFG